jgi:hypothetical protein
LKSPPSVPDTGSLRSDLLASFCGAGGLTEPSGSSSFASVITALGRDAEFAEAFRTHVVGPKVAATRALFERARDRGEVRAEVDLDLLAPALAGIVLHRMFVLGVVPDEKTITAVIDQIILPAALAAPTTASSITHHSKDSYV